MVQTRNSLLSKTGAKTKSVFFSLKKIKKSVVSFYFFIFRWISVFLFPFFFSIKISDHGQLVQIRFVSIVGTKNAWSNRKKHSVREIRKRESLQKSFFSHRYQSSRLSEKKVLKETELYHEFSVLSNCSLVSDLVDKKEAFDSCWSGFKIVTVYIF